MKQQEEKTEQIQIKRRRQSSSISKSTSSSVPLDLASEILLRLPWKFTVRFRCVSKPWSSISTDPNFVKSYETRSKTRPTLLLCFKDENKLCVLSIPQLRHQKPSEPYASSIPIDRDSHFSPTESVRGLICFEESARVIVWNPTTRQFLTLPEPVKSSWSHTRMTVFLGYDPVEGKHKVVCMPRGESETSAECQVWTLGSAEASWRRVKYNLNHRSCYGSYARCINGVLYYLACIDQWSDDWFIMSFDVRYETFNKIEAPSNIHTDLLITYEGKLACVDKKNNVINGGVTLWVLEDAEKHKWSNKDLLAPFLHRDPSSGTTARLNGITLAGEFIYAPLGFYKSLNISFLDPEKNSFRKVESLVEDRFLVSNGVGRRRIHQLCTFPNHVESLMSL